MGALAATGQPQYADGFGPRPPGFERVPFGDAKALEARLTCDADQIAAVLLEPIQGERGVHLPPSGYLRRVRELCSRFRTALVLDEIQTGLGRTGRLFACEEEGIAPDLLLLGKGLGGGLFPLSACLVSAEFWDERFALRHSSTFANNNVACRVGRTVLRTVTEDGFCANVARKGRRLLSGLRELARRFPGVVAEVRGRGLMTAIELRSQAGSGSFLGVLAHQGLYAYAVAATIAELASVLVLPALGDGNVLRIAPPLIITEEEIARALHGIETVFSQLAAHPTETILRALGALEKRSDAVDEKAAVPLVLPPPVVPTPRRQAYPSAVGVPPSGGFHSKPPEGGTPTAAGYAFLIHPTQPADLVTTNPGLERLSEAELSAFGGFLAELPPVLVFRAPPVRSATGAVAEGYIISVPLLPQEMARRGVKRVGALIAQAVDLADHLGARLVGLGGYTAPYSRRGLAVVGRGPAITTGNALTAGVAVAATCRVAEQHGMSLSDAAVAVVGARGSVGSLCARLFARMRPRRLVLLGRPDADGGDDLRKLAACDVILSATTGGRPALEAAPLSPGTIVCDVARPPDASPELRERSDLFVFEGGLVALPDAQLCFGAGNLVGLPAGVQLACLSETILLALEGHRDDHGVGHDVPLSAVDFVMDLAARHGCRAALPEREAEDTFAAIRTPCPLAGAGRLDHG